MDPVVEKLLANMPSAAVIGFVVWWTLRDHGKLLRSIDIRIAKMLEIWRTQRPTPPMGVPTRRRRTHADSDDPEASVVVSRTISDDDIGSDGDKG
jgi:hypothetical protein